MLNKTNAWVSIAILGLYMTGAANGWRLFSPVDPNAAGRGTFHNSGPSGGHGWIHHGGWGGGK